LEEYFEGMLQQNEDNGKCQTYSNFNDHKSAITFLHSINNTPLEQNTEKEMSKFLMYIKSWKITVALTLFRQC